MITKDNRALISISDSKEMQIVPKMINRHGLISGATGTGKTVTLQTMAETFSDLGIPVFIADVKGDLSGISKHGGKSESVAERVRQLGLNYKGFGYKEYPTRFWDIFEKQGHAIKTPVSEVNVMLMERLLGLNDTQGAIVSMAYKIAEDEDRELTSLKDLRQLMIHIEQNRDEYIPVYGNISPSSVGAIQRALMRLENDGASHFFGGPRLLFDDIIETVGRRGLVNILAADELILSPNVYTTFLLWLLTTLYDEMPEVGDLDIPKLVLFFDEAHLIFRDMPKQLLNRIEQVVRLIRSKGIGIYFSTQSPSDIPQSILGQLGNRVQHTLRAYTPRDQNAVKVAAQTFRPNPKYDTAEAITQLETGEALVSFLDDRGAPNKVERSLILPPQSQIGPITNYERLLNMSQSRILTEYDVEVKEKEEDTGEVEDKVKDKKPSKFPRILKRISKAILTFVVSTALIILIGVPMLIYRANKKK